jgi:hypothetical protein
LPVGTLLATSGAVAIVVGLALQSALGDAFSGRVLNLRRPYRIDDWMAVDSTLEGQLIETNWRATHLMTVERHVAIVPNSVMAKTRFVNANTTTVPRGVTAPSRNMERFLRRLSRNLRPAHRRSTSSTMKCAFLSHGRPMKHRCQRNTSTWCFSIWTPLGCRAPRSAWPVSSAKCA